MAGTDDTITPDDDTLYVLTALLLTPANFPTVLGDDYPAACRSLSLEPYEEGYGLVLGQDGAGARWTVVTEDATTVAGAIAAWDCGIAYELSPDDRTVVCALPGWPLALAVAAPGVPAPHDPEPAADDGALLLTPPSESDWGPEQRRMGADQIAARWASWREQVDGAAPGPGEGAAREESPGKKGHPGVRRALEEARDYLDSPPPPGRVRSSFASADVRTLRVDGPGWSLVARTDDMAFVLLDDEPGEVLHVRRGTQLLGLLAALDALATRPA
ncbi:hypothetical protein [Streptomyces sp. NPDC060184]|uniref:hypothetical protein n=1 Tax=Streptomyces sp. NPDC060184 TaxID=3347064 RepID=UPI003662C4B7